MSKFKKLNESVQPVRKTNFFNFLGSKAIFQMNSQSGLLYFMDGKYSGGRLNSSIPTKYFETTLINPSTTVTDTMTAGTFNGGTAFTTLASVPYGARVAVASMGGATITAGTGAIANSGAAQSLKATLIYTGVNPYSGNAIFQVLSIDSSVASVEAAIANGNTFLFMSKGDIVNDAVDITTAGTAVVEASLAITTSNNTIKLVSETEVVNYGFTTLTRP